jgi:hypothetical protein
MPTDQRTVLWSLIDDVDPELSFDVFKCLDARISDFFIILLAFGIQIYLLLTDEK